jgi:1-acyl-sn-glycerol-3-phosphate acyltransferase
MLRRVLRSIVRFLFWLLTRLEVQGLDNIPVQGPAILATNHLGRLDSPLVFSVLERADATSLVADTYKKSIVFGWMVNAVHGIWINRDQADLRALRAATEYLKKGGLLGIAPEGTRSQNGSLMPAKTGVAYLADKMKVVIIPVAITGTEKVFHDLYRFHRSHILIKFGQPFYLPPLERGERALGLQQNTDEIMCRIAAMLPASYRGVYADHSRLKELVDQNNL